LALFNAHLDATGEELEQIKFIVDFIEWISQSDFLRFQQLEPIVGDPSTTIPPLWRNMGSRANLSIPPSSTTSTGKNLSASYVLTL
jgi:hypothetical protein